MPEICAIRSQAIEMFMNEWEAEDHNFKKVTTEWESWERFKNINIGRFCFPDFAFNLVKYMLVFVVFQNLQLFPFSFY